MLLTLHQEKRVEGTLLFGPKGLCEMIQVSRSNDIGGNNLNQVRCSEFMGRKLSIKQEEKE